MIGKRLAHYDISARIGAGGMGEVYRARDTKLDREVALKLLPAGMADDEMRLRRFLQEARAVAALNHPNIVTIFSVEEVAAADEAPAVHFLVMELVKGRPLHELIPEEGLPYHRVLQIAVPLVDALAAAHELGVIHRDLKPSNLMVAEDGRIKILDFGLAMMLKPQETGDLSDLATRTRLTGEGVVVGTMPYMSPEQIESREVGPRSDLFSLGIVLYEMSTGRRPFHGDSSPALMSSILKDAPPPVTDLNPGLPADLAGIISRLLEKDPADRFQSSRELAGALDRLPAEPPAPAEAAGRPAALGGDFRQDIFISYAHLDNEAQLAGQEGWVSSFHRSLEVRVGQLLGKKPVIWRNPKARGDDTLDESQIQRIPQSALLITVLSPRYVKSEWCHRELQEFVQASAATGGPKWGSRFRVFKVVKTPTPVDRHPPEIQPLLGYEFFKVDPQTGRPRELDQIFGPEAQRDYWARLDDLAHDIVELMESAERTQLASASVGPASGAQAEAVPGKGAIYLAQTTSDLREEHDAVRRDLQRHGYTILPERPLPLLEEEIEEMVRSELDRSRLSIHLIGRNYGLVPEGSTASVIAMQNQLAVEHAGTNGFRRVVWIPQGMETEDERQRAFLAQLRTDPAMHRGSELLETPLEDLKTVVHQMLAPPAPRPERALESISGETGVARVYLICDQRDQDATAPLADFLFARGMEVTLPVFEGDEAEVREDHEDNLRLCDAVLLYYGAANELWLRRKLREVQKAAALGRDEPIRARGIWVAAPSTPQKMRLRTREAVIMASPASFAPEPLRPFLDLLGGGAAGS